MSEEFKVISTQEEFDARLKDRLDQQKRSIEAKYADYEDLKNQVKTLSDEKTAFEKSKKETETKYATLQAQLDEANKKARGFELDKLKTDAAIANNLPLELRSRLTGETKEEIEADAKQLTEIFGKQNRMGLPGFEVNEHGGEETTDKEYKDMLREMNKEE